LRGETDPERRHALALLNVQAMRVYEMIADMMLFARPPQPNFARFDAVKLIDELIADLQTPAARQETVLTRIGLQEPFTIEADPTQLAVAIRALAQNALEALVNGGSVQVEVRSSGEELQISVIDDGPGVSAEERRHIFDPFYSARQAGRGLGLGLSKCWRIVTNHGGRVEVESAPGKGRISRSYCLLSNRIILAEARRNRNKEGLKRRAGSTCRQGLLAVICVPAC